MTHTPRRPMQPHPVAIAAAAVLLCAAPGAARAQGATQQLPLLPTQNPCDACARPTAQGAAPQTLPAAPAPAVSFRLNDLRLNGAQALSSEDLRELTTPYIGRDVTLADLEALASAITQRYRERGYFLAQAVVPVQKVQDGIVEISIVEGRIGKMEVNLAPEAPTSEARVRGFLAPVAVGEAVSAPSYERAMLLLSDQPGLRVGSSLQEGTAPGTTDLVVDVNPGPRWSFAAEADNHGTKESGRYRLGGTVRWASPFGIGDNLDLRAMVSNGNALQFGRIAYEAPIGTNGLRVGVGLARVNYELGGEFAELGAQGKADVFDVSLNYPLIRQRQHNLFLRLSADSKKLTDEYRAVDFSARKRVRGFGLGWTWERRDEWLGGGYWASAGTLYRGRLSIGDADLVRVESRHGAAVVRALVTARQRPGSVFVPMHWTAEFAALARVCALVAPVTDPLSGQPASKNVPIRLERFEAGCYGFAICARRPNTEGLDYWALARADGGWRIELAVREEMPEHETFFRRLLELGRNDDGAEILAYRDARRGDHRMAAFEDTRLLGALYLSRTPVAVAREWVTGQFSESHADPRSRFLVVAGRGKTARPDAGATVCSCFGIGINQIAAAVRTGCTTVEAVGRSLSAGTNCGSCRAEIKEIIDAHRLQAAE